MLGQVGVATILSSGENLKETSLRLTEPGTPPDQEKIKLWMGERAFAFWLTVSTLIERKYPGIFKPEWLYGGKKHGWSLRYKKSKSFCTLIPEKGRFALLIVFGAEERARVEMIRKDLSSRTGKDYDNATTYHDGKWLLLAVDSDRIVADMEKLLAVKRKPNPEI